MSTRTPRFSGIPVRSGDVLRLAASSSLTTGNLVKGVAQLVLPDDTITFATVELVSSTDRTFSSTLSVPLPEANLVSATIRDVSGPTPSQPQILRAEMSLQRSGSVMQEICGGNLWGATNLPSFPPTPEAWNSTPLKGRVYTFTGANPAANTEASDAVPSRATWRLISYSIVLVTDANAANRLVQLVVDDGTATNRMAAYGTTTAQTATLTRTHLFGPGTDLPFGADSVALTDTQTVNVRAPIPNNLFLPAGYRIRTVTGAIQVTDDYAAPLIEVEEWLQ